MSDDMNGNDSVEAARLEDQVVALDGKIAELKQQLIDMQRHRDDIAVKYAVIMSAIKVGDRVRDDGNEGVFEVSRIASGWRLDNIAIFARKVKKDGTLGARESRLWGRVEKIDNGEKP